MFTSGHKLIPPKDKVKSGQMKGRIFRGTPTISYVKWKYHDNLGQNT